MNQKPLLLLAVILLLSVLCAACWANAEAEPSEQAPPIESTSAPTQGTTEAPEQTVPAQQETVESLPAETEPEVTEAPAQTQPAETELEAEEPAQTEPDVNDSAETEPEEPTDDPNMGEWA